MYRHNISEMEEAGIAVRSNIPAWMDHEGNIVDEGNAYGYKVKHNIVWPDYYIVADEVGINISITLKKTSLHCILCGNIGRQLMLVKSMLVVLMLVELERQEPYQTAMPRTRTRRVIMK